MKRILVIKLGALGDVVLAFGPFAAIRARHPQAAITLLTTAPFVDLAQDAPWFDHVVVDSRPRVWNMRGVWNLARQIRGFDFVYDLQTSDRSSFYRMLAGRPGWSGIARGASHPHANPDRDRMHTVERQREQLAMAGIGDGPPPDLAWLTHAAPLVALPARFAVLVPGAAPHRPRKRWPAAFYGVVARTLMARGVTPVVLGGAGDRPLAGVIAAACPGVIDLTGQTTIAQIGPIMARAVLAVGNDTGPMHLAAAVGCRCVVLFSADSDPHLTAPRTPGFQTGQGKVQILQVPDLRDLSPDLVLDRVAAALP